MPSNFTIDDLRSLVRESLEGQAPSLVEAKKPLLKLEEAGLLDLQKLVKLQRTFSPGEKSEAISHFVGSNFNEPWAALQHLAQIIEQYSNGGIKATCIKDVIHGVIFLATFADLLFSQRSGQAKGWAMEEWLANATGGSVIPTNLGQREDSTEELGTADIVAGDDSYWSVKLTQGTNIEGSVSSFLRGVGYKESHSDNDYYYFYPPSSSSDGKTINYIFFQKSGSSATELTIHKITSKSILEGLKEKMEDVGGLQPQKFNEDAARQPDLPFVPPDIPLRKILRISKGSKLGSVVNFNQEKGDTNRIKIKIDLQRGKSIVDEQAQQMFKVVKDISVGFDEVTKALSLFLKNPDAKHKGLASDTSLTLGIALDEFRDNCAVDQETS